MLLIPSNHTLALLLLAIHSFNNFKMQLKHVKNSNALLHKIQHITSFRFHSEDAALLVLKSHMTLYVGAPHKSYQVLVHNILLLFEPSKLAVMLLLSKSYQLLLLAPSYNSSFSELRPRSIYGLFGILVPFFLFCFV